ncbi:hypothetical protein ACFQ67_05705 [Streptomyces sp. NPDC056488]|uniref:hypothetical protein n=1 Tax=Streptomyces sp. NPDC056488 TaxID=3345836 RepID=UPI00368ED8CD
MRAAVATIRTRITAAVDVALAAVDVAVTVFVMNVERAGWATTQEPLPTLCEDCDQWHEIDWEQAWPGTTGQEPEQESAMPEQKAAGWLSRLRR